MKLLLCTLLATMAHGYWMPPQMNNMQFPQMPSFRQQQDSYYQPYVNWGTMDQYMRNHPPQQPSWNWGGQQPSWNFGGGQNMKNQWNQMPQQDDTQKWGFGYRRMEMSGMPGSQQMGMSNMGMYNNMNFGSNNMGMYNNMNYGSNNMGMNNMYMSNMYGSEAAADMAMFASMFPSIMEKEGFQNPGEIYDFIDQLPTDMDYKMLQSEDPALAEMMSSTDWEVLKGDKPEMNEFTQKMMGSSNSRRLFGSQFGSNMGAFNNMYGSNNFNNMYGSNNFNNMYGSNYMNNFNNMQMSGSMNFNNDMHFGSPAGQRQMKVSENWPMYFSNMMQQASEHYMKGSEGKDHDL